MSNQANRETFQSLIKDELTLTGYISQARDNGMTNHQITLALTNNGWTLDSITAAFQKEYLLRSNKSIANKGDYIMNTKSGHNPAWFLLGFPGIPIMLGIILYWASLDASFGVLVLISTIATISSLPFWNSNRPLAVGMLIGGLIGLGFLLVIISLYVLLVPCC